ncbi:MAG: 2Fe-2S iron-sulfur cluster-binding protein [Thaumarchaeota archaeon]|nr:2Fe-2S iron-sulfur cluster-binding protein [Nitrososphaerota archaeon]
MKLEGKVISAYEGDTVASALYASGVRTFSRSFLFHRKRGLLCVSGRCPNCMVTVDGVPNVRACCEPAREGMKVKRQNGWPSTDTDIFSGVQLIERFLPVGFYYKTFINFPTEWANTQPMIRRLTGRGSVKQELARWNAQAASGGHGDRFEKQYLHPDVVVVGGGPAGVFAALAASRAGASAVLVHDQPSLGGHLRFEGDTVDLGSVEGAEEFSGMRGYELAAKLDRLARAEENLRVYDNANAFGLYESNEVGVVQGNKMLKLRAKQLIISTGAGEYLTVFKNNDLPGVLLGSGVRRMLALYGVPPGKNAVVVTNNDSGLSLANALLEAGVKVSAFADARTKVDTSSPRFEALRKSGAILLTGYSIKEAEGGGRVTGATLIRLDENGAATAGTEKSFKCDTICLANGFEPDAALLTQARCRVSYDEALGEFIPSESPASVQTCGDVTGIHDLRCAFLQANIAGLQAASGLASATKAPAGKLNELSASLKSAETAYRDRLASQGPRPIIGIVSEPTDGKGRKPEMNGFACICEDVKEKELAQAVEEGFRDIEILKRYSTLTMGPCEGKMCATPGVGICARETGRSIADAGRTVSRPPYLPVPMGALAGPGLHPVKLTAMHYKHLEAGATLMDMGEWKRPHVYTSVFEEYSAVRTKVGIIDLSTLGRLDVKGRDAPKLLDFIYTHTMSKLQNGKSRYGVICDDAGAILDDGTVTRLGEDHYFITTSTGNIDFVEQWLTWWAVAKKWEAQVTNLTSGFAAVNVAGPRARDLLRTLTDVDLSTEKFPYMASGSGLVAGVPCILLRIGFVGETGWEIHFPAEYGEYFWDRLMEAGRPFGIMPFGVETQRLLRLEKMHVIVSQDTDALSTPYEANMAWVVKLDKEDFVGKAALTFAKDEVPQRRLVGFTVEGEVVPHDGDQAFSPDGSTLIGVVTSCRYSPAAQKPVGLALIRSDLSADGGTFLVASGTSKLNAKITFVPFYDPEGRRLKE